MSNKAFLKKAERLLPALRSEIVEADVCSEALQKGSKIRLDFGKHLVGYISLSFTTRGSHPDAPAWLRLQFAERLTELDEKVDEYHGWISAGWVQEEQIHVDVFPAELALPRRYAFRYLQIEVLDLSSRYELVLEKAVCRAVSSADDARLLPYRAEDALQQKMDRVAVNTLHDCMQEVFEDGPKRDRRLWIGDLHLQALANYQTYRQNDLVKRCLYLFAGCTLADGRVAASIFTAPEAEADDSAMFDYSLFFIPTLRDYYEATKDTETLAELWPVAWRQIELSQENFDENGLVRDSNKLGWCFIDWNLELNKQASAQGVYLYCAKAAKEIAKLLHDADKATWLETDIARKKQAAQKELFDAEQGVFLSGSGKQLSWASQIWMVLGDVCEDAGVFDRMAGRSDALAMVTPYLYHYYVQALLHLNRKEKALEVLRSYWGGMVEAGADTFWELYNPDRPDESPYGGTIVNSYCHAWSAGPAYFLRKYF